MLFKIPALLAAGVVLIGCAPSYHGAVPVGDSADAAWVFIDSSDDKNVTGVWRCRDDGEHVVCQRAKMKK